MRRLHWCSTEKQRETRHSMQPCDLCPANAESRDERNTTTTTVALIRLLHPHCCRQRHLIPFLLLPPLRTSPDLCRFCLLVERVVGARVVLQPAQSIELGRAQLLHAQIDVWSLADRFGCVQRVLDELANGRVETLAGLRTGSGSGEQQSSASEATAVSAERTARSPDSCAAAASGSPLNLFTHRAITDIIKSSNVLMFGEEFSRRFALQSRSAGRRGGRRGAVAARHRGGTGWQE